MTLHKEIRLSQLFGGLAVLAGFCVLLFVLVRYRLAVPDLGVLGLAIAAGFLLLVGITGLAMGRMLSVFESSAQHMKLSEAVGMLLVAIGLLLVGIGTVRAWPDPPTLRQLALIVCGMISGSGGIVVLLAERVKFYERTLVRR